MTPEEPKLDGEVRVYEASDYAGLIIGDLKFYFGYEETIPDNPNDDDIETEWAFVVKDGDQEIMRLPQSSLEKIAKDDDSMAQLLLAGIAYYIVKQNEALSLARQEGREKMAELLDEEKLLPEMAINNPDVFNRMLGFNDGIDKAIELLSPQAPNKEEL